MSAALELASRGWRVKVLDPGPIPQPLAASSDISKVMRLAYGADEVYTILAEEARQKWREWNQDLARRGEAPLYHETGILILTEREIQPESFEDTSLRLLSQRGEAVERVDPRVLERRFPAFRHRFRDGFYHSQSGYCEAARAIEYLVRCARGAGVELVTGAMESLLVTSGKVRGVRDRQARDHLADRVVLAAGAWTPKLVPELAGLLNPTAHPLFYLRPRAPERFHPPQFPVFTADITRTGFYGFPLSRSGVVKIGNHGPGLAADPDSDRTVPELEQDRLKQFLDEWLPDLADATIESSRLCWYCDTGDGDFWIAQDPQRDGLVVAAGDSGHAFKFAPVLGRIVADAVEERDNPYLARFRWRPGVSISRPREAARWHGGEWR